MQGLKEVMPDLLERIRAARQANAISAPKLPSAESSAYECPKCRDEGVIHDPARNVAYQCACMERKKLKRIMQTTNMSEDAQLKTFDNFNLDGLDQRVIDAYELAREYSDGLVYRIKKGQSLKGVPWFGLLGTSGSGKTHLVTAAVAPLIEYGVYPLFFNWVQSFTEWFSYYNSPDEAYKVEEIRKRIYNCELLIVDDICKESQKDTWIKEFYGIVDYRYRKQLPIVYTSEYFSELIGFLSVATAGRLFERTKSPKGKKYLGKMLLDVGEDPLALNYRFNGLI
ncbi:ATP-binding protein [Paenibacillus melissococcoides]|uniref:ATP-binding protein n=2 Tax=Paenibacillus TaxID=44249 RepID=A0ABM9GC84_9BACL|nr:ATP-binding protein [Paenibacillus melissococcoides]GIO83002.1 phage-like element PBSX protein XkdC [Paenibacillus dendritiformis]CAH8249604.1 ATP-binding protein [Paenibacillus melissococcoides]CAH8249912.1 ATP-binding protein [Paenibacillus melissococcoides]CAH8718548.1 ATP-binding protein [Paenibacillus melissococcoides]CAH8721373.1 ATP-binding protein [Paenibacillus melissococcoides]